MSGRLSELVALQLRRTRLDISEVARLAEVSRTTVYSVLGGELQHPKPRVLRGLADAFAMDAVTSEVDTVAADRIYADFLVAAEYVSRSVVEALASSYPNEPEDTSQSRLNANANRCSQMHNTVRLYPSRVMVAAGV